MTDTTVTKKFNTLSTFKIQGEEFVVLKKEHLKELMILMNSFIAGEKRLKKGKSRSFDEFLETVSKKKK